MFIRSNVRYIQVIWLCIGTLLSYAARSNLSVAIVSMTDVNSTSAAATVNLSTTQKGTLLGAFFYGYVIGNVIFGFLAYHLSPRIVLAVCGLVCGVVSIVFPSVSTHLGYTATCICRVILGLGEAPFYPCVAALVSNWAPLNERSRMNSFVCSGCAFGPAIMMASTGALSASYAGWPSSFYIPGACILVWGLLTTFVIVDSPDKHKSISSEERQLILLGRTYNSGEKYSVPWLKILRCIPFWAILVSGLSFTWGYWTLQTMVPMYLKGVLHFDITKNGLISAALNLCTGLMNFLFPCLDHVLKTHFNFSLTVHRKIWNCVALYGCGAILLILAFFNVSASSAIALLVIGSCFNAAVTIGFLCSTMDLSPNFAGVTMCFINGLMSITAVAGPTISGLIIQDETSVSEWQRVYIISGLLFVCGNTLFLIFGSSVEQKWGVGPKQKDRK